MPCDLLAEFADMVIAQGERPGGLLSLQYNVNWLQISHDRLIIPVQISIRRPPYKIRVSPT